MNITDYEYNDCFGVERYGFSVQATTSMIYDGSTRPRVYPHDV